MRDDACQSQDNQRPVGRFFSQHQGKQFVDEQGNREGTYGSDELIHVVGLLFADGCLVQLSGLAVGDGYLHHCRKDYAGRKQHVGHRHQEGNASLDNRYQAEGKRQDQERAVNVIFGAQQVVDTFFTYQQTVNVVSFGRHQLVQTHGTQDTVTVKTDEIIHVAVVSVYLESQCSGKHTHQHHKTPELVAGKFVAENQFQLQPHIVADGTETVQETGPVAARDFRRLRTRYFHLDHAQLNPIIDIHQYGNSRQYRQEGERIPQNASFTPVHAETAHPTFLRKKLQQGQNAIDQYGPEQMQEAMLLQDTYQQAPVTVHYHEQPDSQQIPDYPRQSVEAGNGKQGEGSKEE